MKANRKVVLEISTETADLAKLLARALAPDPMAYVQDCLVDKPVKEARAK